MFGHGFRHLRNETLKTTKKQVFLHFETESNEDVRKAKQSPKIILLALQWYFKSILAV